MNGPNEKPSEPPPTRHFQAKLINGKLWIREEGLPGGFVQLPEDDPRYREARLWAEHNARFITLIDWVYNRRNQKPQRNKERYTPDDERYYRKN